MPKILIADDLSPRALDIFRARDIETDVKTKLSATELAACIADYDGLAVRSATKVTAEILRHATRLKVIGRAGIGIDTVDVPAATARGIVVMNTPFGNSITTAEHAIALLFALARQLPAADRSTQAGLWEKSRFMGVEVSSKTLGIIGCGTIGSIVANRALGLHMKVIAYDPFLSEDRAAALGVEKLALDDLLARADFITLHTPLTNETRNILDARALQLTKRGVRIVNCARGGLIVEADLLAALDSGHVAGAALDVFLEEPARKNPLFGHANLIATPHLGAATGEAQENVAIQIAEQMADFLLNGVVANAVNMPSVSAEDAPRLAPYMALARILGGFAGQIATSGLKEVKIDYQGDVSRLNTKPILACVLAGLLERGFESVNMVSAPIIARENGIHVTETTHDRMSDYQTLLGVTLITDTGSFSLSGTLVAGIKPRIVEIQGIALEAELGRHVLYIRNLDKPGFIGAFGETLGARNINIATFHLGRAAPGAEAILLAVIDEAPPPDLLDALCKLTNVVEVRALVF